MSEHRRNELWEAFHIRLFISPGAPRASHCTVREVKSIYWWIEEEEKCTKKTFSPPEGRAISIKWQHLSPLEGDFTVNKFNHSRLSTFTWWDSYIIQRLSCEMQLLFVNFSQVTVLSHYSTNGQLWLMRVNHWTGQDSWCNRTFDMRYEIRARVSTRNCGTIHLWDL